MPPVRILRERHRRPWQRGSVLVVAVLVVLMASLVARAWHLGGAVPRHPVAVALPDREVGAAQAAEQQGAQPGAPDGTAG
jgi:hypothetical protein